jgi:O-antigen/teichoic acid export membrane protein
VLNQVTYPVFSEVQDEKQRLILVLRKIICTSAYVTFPLLLLMILIAKPLFLLLYSERWLPSVPYFRLLCLAGIAICLQNVNYYAIAAIGKSKDLFNWTLVKRGIGLMFVIGGLWLYGIYGLLIGSIVTSWVIYIINAKLVSQHIGYTLMHQFRDLLPIIVLSIIAFLTAYFITLIWPIGLYMDGIIEFTIFVTIYLLSSVIWHLNAYEEAKETILVVINRIGSKSI